MISSLKGSLFKKHTSTLVEFNYCSTFVESIIFIKNETI
ncbi:hypothetical protein JCM19297_2303 [Nonlabens ulvanivorans]|nr:hypothetical protein JCM19297_2303 [Nonlabens ulvanivorans]